MTGPRDTASGPGVLRGWQRLSLVARVMLSASLALAVAGSLLLFVSAGKEASVHRGLLADQMHSEMDSLLPAISEWAVLGDYANIEQVLRQKIKRPDIRYAAWTNSKGNRLEATDQDAAPHAPAWFVRWTGVASLRESRALLIGGRNYGEVTMEVTATPAHNRLWEGFVDHLGILVLALALDFSGILIILRGGLRPLEALGEGARALEGGTMSVRIPAQGSPELAEVIAAFNRMADALQASQDALLQESEQLAVTLSSIGDGVLATDGEGRVTFMNPLAEKLTGWPAKDALGRSVQLVFHIVGEASRDEVECPVGRCLREGVVIGLANHTLLISRDGSERPIADSAAPIRHADGRISGAVLVFRDQTDERRTLDRLAQAASVFDNAINGVVITDAGRRIVDVNPAFTRITGYSREEALGQTPSLLTSGRHDADYYAAMWKEIHAVGQWRGEIWNRHKSGDIYPEELSIVAVAGEDGEVMRYIGIFHDISQVKDQEAQLRQMAHFDPLTGLPNRTLLADRMKIAIARSERSGEMLAVCYVDLDGFKPVNDFGGHAFGDRLLQKVAERMRDTVRGGDTVARIGGDEFVLLLTSLKDMEQCKTSLTRILRSVAQPVSVDGTTVAVTASIGVTLFPDDGVDADALLRHADQALYAAKEAGRNRYHLFDPSHDHALRARRNFLSRLETALVQEEFCLYYQPKVNMHSGSVVGAEALIRWRHPELGLMLPGEFLPLLEDSALEIRIGEWVIDTALAQMDAWRAAGLDLSVSVNIASPHLACADFPDRLKALLDRHPDTPKGRLELEVLESVALADLEHISRLITDCRAMGVAFSLDDFGTGYSSLSYLKRLPVDLIKIDQSFVRDMLGNPEELAIIDGVVGLAGAFRSGVIAEGVETAAHGLALTRLGCHLGQGFGIARPMPAHEMQGWVAGWRPDATWQPANDSAPRSLSARTSSRSD